MEKRIDGCAQIDAIRARIVFVPADDSAESEPTEPDDGDQAERADEPADDQG